MCIITSCLLRILRTNRHSCGLDSDQIASSSWLTLLPVKCIEMFVQHSGNKEETTCESWSFGTTAITSHVVENGHNQAMLCFPSTPHNWRDQVSRFKHQGLLAPPTMLSLSRLSQRVLEAFNEESLDPPGVNYGCHGFVPRHPMVLLPYSAWLQTI